MFEFIPVALAAAGLALNAIGWGHLKAKVQSVIIHHATYRNLLPDHPVWNRRLAQTVGILTFNSDFDGYRKGADGESGHVGYHSKAFASEADEESQFVLAEGFRPGMTCEALWRQHWRTLFGPGFHSCQLAKRLRTGVLVCHCC